MALWKPRLEWNDQTVNATKTNLSPVLSGISSTAEITVGMIAQGNGIPTGATVISKTVNSVTLSEDATLSETSEVNLFNRYDFEFPPTRDTEDKFAPKQTQTESLSGISQTTTNYIEAIRDMTFWFVNQADCDFLRDSFYLGWAVYGNEFRMYPDQDEPEFDISKLDTTKFSRNRQVKKHPNFKYSFSLSFRKIVY